VFKDNKENNMISLSNASRYLKTCYSMEQVVELGVIYITLQHYIANTLIYTVCVI